MNDYTKGILTGASLILCFFMFVSAKSQVKDGEFEDIYADEIYGDTLIVRCIMITDDGEDFVLVNSESITGFTEGSKKFSLSLSSYGGGALATANADGELTSFLGTIGDVGSLSIFNNGKKDVSIAGGHIETYNKHEVNVGYFGNGDKQDGIAILSDRYGDIGWAESGKK